MVAIIKRETGSSLAVQWLGLCAFTAEVLSSIPGRGTKILHASWCDKKKERDSRTPKKHAHSFCLLLLASGRWDWRWGHCHVLGQS